jgi:transcription elongation GreA/GreB family factor|tara:strand:+ start:2148 stop:2630 length:483 start_codon:yes stop_codon:yes gene_type:complete
MDKLLVLEGILKALALAAQQARNAAQQAHQTATHAENVAENKYDTLGLEAAYLAHGQSLRVVECGLDIEAFQAMKHQPWPADQPIHIGALVCLLDDQNNQRWLFLGPRAGGLKFHVGGREIVLITPSAPLGKALLGCLVNTEITVNINGQHQHHEIIGIY